MITSVCETPFAEAISVAFSVVFTADAVTVKAAEVLPLATVMEAGTTSELLLLDNATTVWLVAGAFRATVHPLVCAPVSDCVPHDTLLSVGADAAIGLSAMISEIELPSAVAVKVTFWEVFTADAVTLKVTEVFDCGTVTEAGTRSDVLLLDSFTMVWMVAAALRDTVQTCVCAPVIESVPHETPLKLTTGIGELGAGESVSTSVFLTPAAVAVSVALCEVLTADTVTLKDALILPASTVTNVGVFNEALLLESSTDVLLAAVLVK